MIINSLTIVVFLCCIFATIQDILGGTKCLKNEVIGDTDGNIYYCPNGNLDKTECCEKDQEFTCCEPAAITNLKDQLLLWGTVAGVVVLLVIVGICIKKDFNICKSDRWIFYKYTKKGKDEMKKSVVSIEQKEDRTEYKPNFSNSAFVYDDPLM